METLKFITFADVHASVVNPASRIGDYESDIFDKLKQIKTAGEKIKADFFLFAGDLFNLKAPMRNPHALNTKLIDLFKSFPAPIYATEGNHDLRNDNYETFEEQPLQVIYSSGALHQARSVTLDIKGMKVRIRSFPFQEEPDLTAVPAIEGGADLNICLLHVYSTKEGGSLFHHKLYSYDEIAALGDDIFVIGHYHIDQGIHVFQKNGKQQIFINVGAISRGTYTDEDLNRIPKIGLIYVDKKGSELSYTTKTARLNVRLFNEVFDVEKREEDKKKIKEAEAFVSKLQSDLTVVTEEEDKIKIELANLDIEKAVLNKVIALLDEADLNKKALE
jgi:DNA repair exonuclease SbcCD nuclease subunit